MKSILISIKPEWVAKILNGEKTIEIRKTAPKCDLPIDVYIYCTKGDKKLVYHRYKGHGEYLAKNKTLGYEYNGVVVAKFTLNKVEELYSAGAKNNTLVFETKSDGIVQLYKRSCLDVVTLSDYLESGRGSAWGYAWHISNLVVFDEPKELEQFDYPNPSGIRNVSQRSIKGLPNKKQPPQSWCYVEVKETTKHESY